jgi:hypothetical protein
VNGSLYVWNVNNSEWRDMGNIQGPQGAKGDTGPAGPQGARGNPGPAGPQSLTLIPFASRTASRSVTNASGAPQTLSLITFGGDPPVIPLRSDGTATLGNSGQAVFSLPFDAIIENIYINVGNLTDFTPPSGTTVYPFVELFTAAPASNIFTALPQTKVVPSAGFTGLTYANTMRAGSVSQMNVRLTAGTRILIGGQMQTTGSGALTQTHYFYFTGGIALRPA